MVLKLKTDRFRILTRSLTSANPPSSAEELATIARLLCDRVDLPPQTLYRLAGVGMSNFADPQEQSRQPDLFGGAFRRNPTCDSPPNRGHTEPALPVRSGAWGSA